MRQLVNIERRVQLDILERFPDIQIVITQEMPPDFHISVFDHWLSEEEAMEEITDVANLEYLDRLHSFCYALFSEHPAYFIKRKGINKQRLSLKSATSQDALYALCTPEHPLVSDRVRFSAILPSLGIAYFEGCDYTHHIYGGNESTFKYVENLAKIHQVSILSKL